MEYRVVCINENQIPCTIGLRKTVLALSTQSDVPGELKLSRAAALGPCYSFYTCDVARIFDEDVTCKMFAVDVDPPFRLFFYKSDNRYTKLQNS